MDVRNLQFADASFDIVIDKGLLDAVSCGDGSAENVSRMLTEIHRVLTPAGIYFCISHAKMIQRKKYLKNVKKYNWTIAKKAVPKPGIGANPKEYKVTNDDEKDKKACHFIYTMTKQTTPVVDSEAEVVEENKEETKE